MIKSCSLFYVENSIINVLQGPEYIPVTYFLNILIFAKSPKFFYPTVVEVKKTHGKDY